MLQQSLYLNTEDFKKLKTFTDKFIPSFKIKGDIIKNLGRTCFNYTINSNDIVKFNLAKIISGQDKNTNIFTLLKKELNLIYVFNKNTDYELGLYTYLRNNTYLAFYVGRELKEDFLILPMDRNHIYEALINNNMIEIPSTYFYFTAEMDLFTTCPEELYDEKLLCKIHFGDIQKHFKEKNIKIEL